MSIDVHKYGMASKGASCVVYRSPDLRKCQYTAVANWSGACCTSRAEPCRHACVVHVAVASCAHPTP